MKMHRVYICYFALFVLLGIAMFCPPTSAYAEPSFPAKYSSADQGWVNDPRDQGINGTCWAFAATSAIEINAIKNGFLEKGDLISPWQLAYAASYGVKDPLHNLVVPKVAADKGSSDYLDRGGCYDSVITAASNHGTLHSEMANPYDERFEGKIIPSTDPSNDKIWIKEAFANNPHSQAEVKQAILDHGSVCGSFEIPRCEDGLFNYTKSASYVPAGVAGGFHAMTIVGWDDNFKASDFIPVDTSVPIDLNYKPLDVDGTSMLPTIDLSSLPEPKIINTVAEELVHINATHDSSDDSALVRLDVPAGKYNFDWSIAGEGYYKITFLTTVGEGKVGKVWTVECMDEKNRYNIVVPEDSPVYVLVETDGSEVSVSVGLSTRDQQQSVDPPSRDGAWLVKDSHGVDHWKGDNGYMWISYESALLEYCYFETMPANTYDHLYQYDGFNHQMLYLNSSLGNLEDVYWLQKEGDNQDLAIAESFVAQTTGDIRAVALSGLESYDEGGYRYQIYLDVSDPSDPTSGTPVFPDYQSTDVNNAFKVLELPEGTSARILEGQRFSVVVQLPTRSIFRRMPISLFLAEDEAPKNVSFVNKGDGIWHDTTADGYLCRIKAFVDDLPATGREVVFNNSSNDNLQIAATGDENGLVVMLVLIGICGSGIAICKRARSRKI